MNIVIIDDAKVNAKLTAAYVKKLDEVSPLIFTSAIEGLAYCLENEVDLLLVDYKMPDMDGLAIIRKIRSVPEKSGVPIVMITSVDETDVLRLALDYGANDFLTKPVDEIELTARVKNMLSLRAYSLEFKKLATIDSLTETYNRRYFLEEAAKEFSRSRRYGAPLSILMVDADKFKQVNDTYGHAGGDAVLASLSNICRPELRDIDFIGRLGGEEFAICLAETTLTQALVVAERLRKSIENSAVSTAAGSIKYTVSMGVTEVTGNDEDFASALDRADKALFIAKANGRNTIVQA